MAQTVPGWGDFRVNQNLGLVVFQTIFLREHNRIAKELYEMHPEWSDETLFQEARRISIAQYLHITYNEFLPAVIGEVLMKKLRLASPKKGFTNFYSPQFDPSTMNEFTAAAFRGLHGLVPNHYDLSDEERCPFSKILLKDIYVNPGVIEQKHNFDALCRGLTSQPCECADTKFVSGVTNFLLKLPNAAHGTDLESFDIQRGRDHGLPTYNDMRHYCGLRRAKHFRDLLDNVHRLKSLYDHVDDIEFFVGGVMERRGVLGDSNALVGHTFGCVIGEQFWRWKLGDRYFYDLGNQAGSFTLEQINGIKKTSLAALICENLSIKHIQPHAFLQISKRDLEYVFGGKEKASSNKSER
ncbi:hypothetical protein J437_LFUL006897 [Ladona fulva]|uniref:Peroxidase n=1 Tax=Ladona fulva TaxID=123851 RepID=A0A8K0NYL2_LADFU|nr:hypothetical protein J437_LFUL006897 [Ladona fulva]